LQDVVIAGALWCWHALETPSSDPTYIVRVCVSLFSSTGRFKTFLDSYCGLCIVVLYFLYLNVVKGALSVFDCSKNKDGVWILDADPSIKCYVVRVLFIV
jgi:hypothetical protein